MFARLVSAAVLFGAFLLTAGCGPAKLNTTKTWDNFESGDAKGIDLDAQPKPQTITVEFSSSESDVTVLVFKKEEIKSDEDMLGADASKALGKQKGKSGSFTADIPENTATRVVVRDAGKKTKVELKVTNKS